MKSPLRLTIHRKLWGLLLFFLVFMAAGAATTYLGTMRISRYLDSNEVETLRHTVALKNNLNEIEQYLNDAAAQREPALIGQAKQIALEFDDHITVMINADPVNKAQYEKIKTSFHEYFVAASGGAMQLLRGEGFSSSLLLSAEKVNTTLPPLREDVEKLISNKYVLFERMLTLATGTAKSIVRREILLTGFIALIGFALMFKTIDSILKPIDSLLNATKELGRGNLTIRTPVISNDEVGELAASFNDMADRLKNERDKLEESRQKLAQLLQEREEMQKEIVKNNEDLKLANALLQKADLAKSQFLASMSHELRTPLNAMINFTDQIIEDWEELKNNDEWFTEAREMLTRVLGSSRHLLEMINELLDLAKIEAGKMTLDLEEADLAGLVRECVLSVSSLAKKKNIQVITSFPNGETLIICDRRKVKQVVINLLGNAIKFTDHGEVRVSVAVAPEGYRIIVSDTGIGIPEEYHARIWDRFQQVDGSDNRKHAGTGLGLNLVKELTEMHGGTVELSSLPGDGATFTVYLPAKAVGGKSVVAG